MKTAREVLDRALQLCGFVNSEGAPDRLRDADIYKRGLALVNQIYTDMFFAETPDGVFRSLGSMEEEIPLSARCVNDIMPYGVAMLLAGAEGDATAQSLFSYAYNQKRAGGVKSTRRIADRMPRGEW
ncbi:MAG: hypothetical protein E7549_01975 [Ruminococcaceae bacterium]|nr:hypothetical protein [Oscillospiraceae bacterium]